MGTKLRASPKFSMIDSNGDPAAGYKIHTYVAGTTTNKATYTDNAQSATNTNPVILDSRGEADIWWSGSYKVVVKDSDDVTIYTVDNYGAGEDISVSGFYNLATNGSFEIDDNADNLPDDWDITEYDATSTVIIDATDPNHGANCLKFVSTGLGGGYAASVLMEVSGSQSLSIGFNIKSSVVDVRNRVEVSWYDKDQALLSTTGIYDDSATNPTSWTDNQYSTTSHASAKYAKIVIYGCHSSDATSGETRFDNIRVVEITGTMMLQNASAVAITGGSATGMTLVATTNLFVTPPNTAGSGTAYTATVGETAYVTNRVYAVTIHTDNTGSATINLDGIGAKTIKTIFGSNLTAGQLQQAQIAYLTYDGTDMFLLNPQMFAAENLLANSVTENALAADIGAWVIIESQTASADSTIDFTTSIGTTYDAYMVKITNLRATSTGAPNIFGLRTQDAGGWNTTGYGYNGTTSQDRFKVATTIDDAADSECIVYFSNPESTTGQVLKAFSWGTDQANAPYNETFGGNQTDSAAVTGIRFLMASDTIKTGEFVLYGMNK